MAILRRTVLMEVDRKNGNVYYRPMDWARVVTTLGTMAEPFFWERIGREMGTTTQIDHEGELNMVNDIEFISLDHASSLLGENVHGYYALESRDGR